MERDEVYMGLALEEAKAAFEAGEVPIGAVLINGEGNVIFSAHNERETRCDATAHAELVAVRGACEALGKWRLSGTTMYVTVEPCPMCAGALVMARVPRLVYGCPDSKAGAVDSLFNVTCHPALNHRIEVTAGVREEECAALMKEFFAAKRKNRRR